MANIANLLNVVALIALMAAMGLRVNLVDVVASTKRKAPLLLGLAANYVVVPVATCALLYVCGANPLAAAGFLVLAVCPGAPVGPPLTEIARGNVALSIGLMLILAALSAVLSPALLMLLISRLLPAGDIHIDYLAIVKVLMIAQLLPLIVGLCVKKIAPDAAEKIAKPIDKVAKVLFLVVLVLIMIGQYRAFAMVRLTGWLGMAALLAISLYVGWLCGGKDASARKALALTTATRNAGVGLVIVLANFAGTAAVAAVVVYTVVSIIGCLILAVAWRRQSDAAQPEIKPVEPPADTVVS